MTVRPASRPRRIGVSTTAYDVRSCGQMAPPLARAESVTSAPIQPE
jgi:hypothetical protein